MAVWGVEGGPVKLIYGLLYYGGGTFTEGEHKGEMYTRVFNSTNTFEVKLTQKEMLNLGEIYIKFLQENPTLVPPEHLYLLRKSKLQQIDDDLRQIE